MRTAAALLALLALLALSACKRDDMFSQAKSRSWDASSFFSNGASMRPPPAGTLARDQPWSPVPEPARIDAAMLLRGQQRFEIFCAPCHGRGGDGEGMIVQRGFPRPPALYVARLRKAKAAHFYEVITHGHGVMYSYASRVSPADRWNIAAYIRALQLSQDAIVAALPAADRARLEVGR